MNRETENNNRRTEPVANAATKKSWHTPEIEEVDFAETQSGVLVTADGGGHS